MEEVEYLLAKIGFIKRPRVQYDFRKIEALIGFQLPDDYKYYQNNYEPFDGDIGEQYVVLDSADELSELNDWSTFDEYSSQTIAIGSNGASETIGIRFITPNTYKIVIAQYIQDIDDQIEIGLSFTDMLRRLDEGIEWFA